MLGTAHYTFMQFQLRIDPDMRNISIALQLVHHPESAQIAVGMILCTTFSVNTCMYKDYGQYGKVLSDSMYLKLKHYNNLLMEKFSINCQSDSQSTTDLESTQSDSQSPTDLE